MGAVFTIDPGQSFLKVLAQGLIERLGDDLADALVLLPSRRACVEAREAFAEVTGGAPMLLPRLEPVGELGAEEVLFAGGAELEVPPAIPQLRRRLLLSMLIKKQREPQGGVTDEHAIRLAGELAAFLDELETEEVDLDGLDGLVPDVYAEHWQQILVFLRILGEAWPAVLAEEGATDPALRRRMLLGAVGRAWMDNPPEHPVIAAGITGTVPAVARLMAAVRDLPRGWLVLPGLDLEMERADWEALERTPAHPQHGLHRLLNLAGIGRGEVRPWPVKAADATPPTRSRFLAEIMRPAATSEAWQRLVPPPDDAVRGLDLLEAPDSPREALVLALKVREALEEPGKKVALVTTDRTLARRVAVELERWGVRVDDTGGTPLDQTPAGGFALLTARALVEGLPPVPLLAALKHPLAKGGREQGEFRRFVRTLEQAALRGPRLAKGFVSVEAAIKAIEDRRWAWLVKRDELLAWLAEVERRAARLVSLGQVDAPVPIALLLDEHLAFLEWLASDQDGDSASLWSREPGEALASFFAELKDAARGVPPLTPTAWPAFLAVLMGGQAVRYRRPAHPRAVVWGQIEQRLLHADRVLLAGLNEGHWPRTPAASPWLSRAMRKDLGLPPVELQIGIAAHDLFTAASAPEVTLSRARKDSAGQPSQSSRWLARLEAVLIASKLERKLDAAPHWLAWAEALDAPGAIEPCARPEPRPPVAARPRSMAVTSVERLIRDPYAFYAKEVLKLAKLEPLDDDPGGAERGRIVHEALEAFVKEHPLAMPPAAEQELLHIGAKLFKRLDHHPEIRAVWWPRFVNIARWFLSAEAARRSSLKEIRVEAWGRVEIMTPAGGVELKARADRIEALSDGAVRLVDYKTGTLPSPADVRMGLSPQLSLTALILRDGGFGPAFTDQAAELLYWGLKGDEDGGVVSDPTLNRGKVERSVDQLIEDARHGLARLVAHYDDPSNPYTAIPRPEIAPAFSDYDHLARVDEWRGSEAETPLDDDAALELAQAERLSENRPEAAE